MQLQDNLQLSSPHEPAFRGGNDSSFLFREDLPYGNAFEPNSIEISTSF